MQQFLRLFDRFKIQGPKLNTRLPKVVLKVKSTQFCALILVAKERRRSLRSNIIKARGPNAQTDRIVKKPFEQTGD